jgi:hypothetical protein
MRQSGKGTHIKRMTVRVLSVRLGALTAVLIALSFVVTSYASADGFETVGHFGGVLKAPEIAGQYPEEVQLGNAAALAVNTTGAGGVAPGTIYAVDRESDTGVHVARFGPTGNFEELWILRSGKRCGPEIEDPDHPGAYVPCSANIGGGNYDSLDVEVDQANGNVYVLTERAVSGFLAPGLLIYNADGTHLIAEFGEADQNGTIAGSPAKIHKTSKGGMAINDSGDVYVFDEDKTFNHRVMLFKPETPGDYEHYVYAGQGSDIAVGGNGAGVLAAEEPVLDQAGNLFGRASDNNLVEYDPSQPSTPICTFNLPPAGITAQTVNPVTGDVFYYSYKDREVHQMACNGEGEFVEVAAFRDITPERGELDAMTMDGERKYGPERPAGVLYGASPAETSNTGFGGEPGGGPLGYIFAPPKEISPSVESESVSNVTSSTASLGAEIDPNGAATRYGFQYLGDAAYEANEPDERQSLIVSADGGVFGLGLEGRRFGGEASATVTAGSKTVGALVTAKGAATLTGAVGTGTLKGGEGKGTFIAGSNVISSVSVAKGEFKVGQGIAGAGIPTGAGGENQVDTTITGVAPEEGLSTFQITISSPATKSAVGATVTSGARSLTEVSTSEGKFEVGQTIEGGRIPAGTTIVALNGSELVLSRPATMPGVGLSVHAGFPTLTEVSPSLGSFEVGQQILGEGIPTNTQVLAVNGSELILSKPVSKPGVNVSISSPGPAPWAVGEQVEGPGIPQGTTIDSIKEGEATLSNPATASGSGVILHAGLPANAPAAKVHQALEGLPTVGKGNVKVSGGPGDETGSSPYEVTFVGKLENVDVPQLSVDASSLAGSPATATVETENDGGGGFAGALEAPPGGAELGSGQSPLSATAVLSGLTPDTGYHFRAVAISHCSATNKAKVCEGLGASLAFHTAASEAPKLPDDRAWELVSPAQKHGGQVIPSDPGAASCGTECKPGAVADRFPQQSSADGEAVVYMGFPFSPTEGAVTLNEYLSRRDEKTGWQTTTLSPELTKQGGGKGYLAFDISLSRALLYQGEVTLTPEAPNGYADLYGQPTASPSALSALLRAAPPNRPEGAENFRLNYAGASADLSRVFFEANDALTEETPFAPEAADGGAKKNNLYEWSEEGLRLVNVAPGNLQTKPGAAFGSGIELAVGNSVQANFSHAISADGSRAFWSSESGQVYLRENGETTREISDHAGKFLTASADGSKLLLNDGHLFDLANGEQMIDLTEGKGGFEGIAGQSEDLSRIYFADTEVLDETPNENGDTAQKGKGNLYAWQEGSTRFIAALLPGDGSELLGDLAPSPGQRTAEASPNGRWLAFQSAGQPTGYDNVGACDARETPPKDAPCREAYLYDSATAQLRCASCNRSGEAPLGGTNLRLILAPQGFLPQPRYLTDEGRLYFDSQDSLSSFDTNEGVEDVYQYEPNGVGSCTKEGGCVSLISAGHESVDSNFLTMDPSGRNVFFTTRDQLTLKDKDDLLDVYDAREGGGIPSETETGRGECQGEACQPLYSPPNDPTPGSSSFHGAGNVNETRAAKKHPKKHRKKRHAKKKKHAHGRAAKHNRGGAK